MTPELKTIKDQKLLKFLNQHHGTFYKFIAIKKPFECRTLNGIKDKISPLDLEPNLEKPEDKLNNIILLRPYRGTGFLNSLNRLVEFRRDIHESNIIIPEAEFRYAIIPIKQLIQREMKQRSWGFADTWAGKNKFKWYNNKMVNHINLENITYEDRIKLNRIFFIVYQKIVKENSI
jgi:hypothetical protein